MMNAYNPIQNVNTIIAERNQFKVRCSQLEENLFMQSQNYQSQLKAVIYEAEGIHKADLKTIEQLSGTIESLKSQRELGSESLIMTVWVQFGAEKQMERKKKSDI